MKVIGHFTYDHRSCDVFGDVCMYVYIYVTFINDSKIPNEMVEKNHRKLFISGIKITSSTIVKK